MTAPERHYGENENLTLTDADLSATGDPRPYAGGEKLRAYCPVHGGDHQRSLEVDQQTGRFFCHNCGCWGYMDWSREEFARERGYEREASRRPRTAPRRVVRPAPPPPPVEPARDDLEALAETFREALPGSWGERYLGHRGIPVDLAREYGIGYAIPGEWPGRGWKGGRLVAPHTRPDGVLVNLYGRAVAKGEVPKGRKHDHLPGSKGYFNASALREDSGPLYVVEGVMDALALIAGGCKRTVAIYAARDWRWHWLLRDVRQLVLAFDADETGVEAREKLAGEARLRGIEVAFLDADAYGGENDPAAAYAAGTLDVGEWPEAKRLLEETLSEAEAWDPGWAGSLYSKVLRDFARLTREAGLDLVAVDTAGVDGAMNEMAAAEEAQDAAALKEAAARARAAARRAVADASAAGDPGRDRR